MSFSNLITIHSICSHFVSGLPNKYNVAWSTSGSLFLDVTLSYITVPKNIHVVLHITGAKVSIN